MEKKEDQSIYEGYFSKITFRREFKRVSGRSVTLAVVTLYDKDGKEAGAIIIEPEEYFRTSGIAVISDQKEGRKPSKTSLILNVRKSDGSYL